MAFTPEQLELYNRLSNEGDYEGAYQALYGNYVAPAPAASAASGLLSSLNSSDSSALQGLLSQFRRAEEERQFADAGRQDDEPDSDLSTGGRRYVEDFINLDKILNVNPIGQIIQKLGVVPGIGGRIMSALNLAGFKSEMGKRYKNEMAQGAYGFDIDDTLPSSLLGGLPLNVTTQMSQDMDPISQGLLDEAEAFKETPEMYRDTDPALNNEIIFEELRGRG